MTSWSATPSWGFSLRIFPSLGALLLVKMNKPKAAPSPTAIMIGAMYSVLSPFVVCAGLFGVFVGTPVSAMAGRM